MAWNVWSLTENRWLMLASVASKRRAQAAIEGFLSESYPASSMEPRRVHSVLEQHGTTLMQFKPDAIWRMAMDDFNRRDSNATSSVDEMRPYHFHRDHVRKATTANDILRAAIEDPEKGQSSGKKITRLLYADPEHLRLALK